MKKLSIVMIALIVISCNKTETQKEVTQSVITEKETRETLHKWAQSMLDNSLEPQQNILDDTWMYSGADDGTTTSKEEALAGFKPGETTLKKVILQDTVIRIYGSTAIVTGKEELVFVENQDTSRVFLRFTDVFIKKDGSVKAISTHSSPIKNE